MATDHTATGRKPVDRAPAFIRYAATRSPRQTTPARSALVKLARWHAPTIGRDHWKVPPLRNRADVRRWALEAGRGSMPGDVEGFTRAAEKIWLAFCCALESDGYGREAVAAARSMAELDRDERLADETRAVVLAWADAFQDRAVTTADLIEDTKCRQAIGLALADKQPQEGVTVRMAARVIARLATARIEAEGWRAEKGKADTHRKVMRYRLRRPGDDEADAPAPVVRRLRYGGRTSL